MSYAKAKCNVLENGQVWSEMDISVSTDEYGEIHVTIDTARGIVITLNPTMSVRLGNALRDAALDVVGDIAHEIERSKYNEDEGK